MQTIRLWRVRQFTGDRANVALVVLLGLAAAATAGLSSSTQGDLSALVQRDWRGAYDLLVLPPGQGEPSVTGGYVEPNFVTTSTASRISDRQLERIRQIAGVEVAAPIGAVGAVRTFGVSPVITAPADARGVFRIDTTVAQSRGGIDQPVYAASGCVLLDPATADGASPPVSTFSDAVVTDSGASVYLPSLPAVPHVVLAVDPVAEKALLGDAGGFLDPLVAAADDSRTAAHFPAAAVPAAFPFEGDVIRALGGSDGPTDRATPVVPVVVLQSPSPTTILSARVRRLVPTAAVPADEGGLAAACDDQANFDDGRDSQVDAGPALQAFQRGQVLIPWPGASTTPDPGPLSQIAADLRPAVTMGSTYDSSGPGSDLAFSVRPLGVVSIGSSDARGPQADLGHERAYRALAFAEGSPVPAGQQASAAYAIAPLGSVALNRVTRGTGAVSYVPLGGYDPEPMYEASTADESLPPSLSGEGLVAAPPAAVTDLLGGRALRGSSPIDAIRVRLSGVTKFGADARQRIADVAAQISGLGLSVRVVAGSSLAPVTIHAPGYFGVHNGPSKSSGISTTSDGSIVVSQEWTNLGAALRVFSAFSSVTKTLLVLAALVLAGLAALSATTRIPMRRRQVAALGLHGWTRADIRGLLLGEIMMGAVIVAAISVVGGVIAGFSTAQAVITMSLLGAYVLFASLTTRAVLHRRATHPMRPRRTVRTSPLGLAWAEARPIAWPLLARAMCVAVAAGATTAAAVLVRQAIADAGRSRIATSVTSQLQPQQWALVGVVLAAATIGALLAGTAVSRNRVPTTATLRYCGWTPGYIARTIDPPFLAMIVPTNVVSIVVYVLIVPAAGMPTWLVPSAVCLAVCTVVHLGDRRRIS